MSVNTNVTVFLVRTRERVFDALHESPGRERQRACGQDHARCPHHEPPSEVLHLRGQLVLEDLEIRGTDTRLRMVACGWR
jgi:hypothetical protein